MAAPSFLRERLHPAPEVEGVVGPGVLLGVAQTPSGQKPPPPDAPKRRLLATGGVRPPNGRPVPGVRMRVRIRTNERSRSRLPGNCRLARGRSLEVVVLLPPGEEVTELLADLLDRVLLG